ncbi:hypothetical protein AAC387_Pa06g2201 [Persea americana]
MPVGLKDCQGDSSKKKHYVITKQDVPNEMPSISVASDPSTKMTSTSEITDDQQNTPPEDVLGIIISDTSSGSNEDRRVEFKKAPDVVTFSSSDSFIIETHEVITLEAEPTNPRSEPKVTSCHVAAGIREVITTSSTSIDMEDMVEGMRNLFSQQEEVMAIQKSTGSGLRSGKV